MQKSNIFYENGFPQTLSTWILTSICNWLTVFYPRKFVLMNATILIDFLMSLTTKHLSLFWNRKIKQDFKADMKLNTLYMHYSTFIFVSFRLLLLCSSLHTPYIRPKTLYMYMFHSILVFHIPERMQIKATISEIIWILWNC